MGTGPSAVPCKSGATSGRHERQGKQGLGAAGGSGPLQMRRTEQAGVLKTTGLSEKGVNRSEEGLGEK